MRHLWLVALACGCSFDVHGVSIDGSGDGDGSGDLSAAGDGAADQSVAVDQGPALDFALDLAEEDQAAPDLQSLSGDLALTQCLSSCGGCANACCNDTWSGGGSTNTTFACPDSCDCLITTDGTHDNALTCPTGATCRLTAANDHNNSLSCGAGGTCELVCTGDHSCIVACATGASCLVQCTAVAQPCNITNCIPTTCPNGVKVCGRACP